LLPLLLPVLLLRSGYSQLLLMLLLLLASLLLQLRWQRGRGRC
jgi:hypothetical protein